MALALRQKINKVLNYLDNLQADIRLLQETQLPDSKQNTLR